MAPNQSDIKSGETAETAESAEHQIVEQSKRIDFYITEYTVEILATKMRQGEYVVPGYQREFTWEPERKSRFIESVIMGLPIPFIFFWEMPDGRLEVVDGSQRLRTLEEFVLGDFRLRELGQLSHLSGFRFADLLPSRQRKVRNRSIRGIVLNEHADEAARLDMFERINTGSKIAKYAEIRRGALAGPFLEVVIELAQDPTFVRLAPMSKTQVDERGREELVTRFFAYGDGLEGYKDRPADFIFNYSKKMNEALRAKPTLADTYRQRFHRTMKFVDHVFPHGFARTPNGKATPRARYESIAIGAFTALEQRPDLVDKAATDLSVEQWLSSDEFKEITGSDGANAIARLRRRIEFTRDRLVDR